MRISDWSSYVGSSDLAAADQALHGENGIVRIGHGLRLGGLADQAFAVLGEGNDGGRGARAFRIFNDLGLPAIHHSHAAVGGAQVNTDYFSHFFLFNPNFYQRLTAPYLTKAPRQDRLHAGYRRAF